MNLAVDIGNTLIKAAVFEDGQIVEAFKAEQGDGTLTETIFNAYPQIGRAIVVSGKGDDHPMIGEICARVDDFLYFDPSVPVPIKNLYETPQTLGCDRLAAAVGANLLYPGSNVMVADFGTAITIDVVTSEGEFIGGNISPGTGLRFLALHRNTSKLPLLTFNEDTVLVGSNSRQAIESGVINGIVYEIEGYISRLTKEYKDLRIIFTGGDGNFFAKRLKNTIFATYDLVVYGLNRILEYNAEK